VQQEAGVQTFTPQVCAALALSCDWAAYPPPLSGNGEIERLETHTRRQRDAAQQEENTCDWHLFLIFTATSLV
jgi:hypothetical protein